MLSFVDNTEFLGAGIRFLADVPGPGGYFSIPKIVLALVAFGVLARCMSWVDADLGRVHGPRTLWNILVFTAGLLAVTILLFVPSFTVALLLFAATGAAGVGSYVFWRNSVVGEEDRVLTTEHIKKVLSGQRGKSKETMNLMPDLNIAIQQLNGALVMAPEDDELLQTGFQLAHFLLADALAQRATDVALVAAGQAVRLLYQIDGVTTERQRLTQQDSSALIGFIKYAGKMNPAEKRVPQRGELVIKSGVGLVNVGIRTAGSSAGERMDIKISSEARELTFKDLRLPSDQLAQVQSLAEEPKGLVVVTGRQDCGVTTSLYAFLHSHDAYVQHIHAIETRPLVELENVTRHKPNVSGGKVDTAGTLRSVLRGDPGVVLAEPVKDAATLKMMLKAGRERKLYAGMSNSSVFSALTEVMTLAGDPGLVSRSLKGLVGQKLMRKLCPSCREAYQPDAALLKRLNLPAEKIRQFYRPPTKPLVDNKGKPIICSTCKGTGYFGRVGAFEVLVLSEEMRKLV
ncbi:MAG: Flp pilus assembly complex ATPase component TadA, partial [Phycisphaerae bacterium]|nr:Flp pilus assembly complex ATPase component TadA [Phycisphaerae bacterium]